MIQLFSDSNHFITLERAKEMVRMYREQRRNILKPEYAGSSILPDSETFNREAIDRLIAQPRCAGLRIYYGMDEQLNTHAILIAVNENNEDLLPSADSSNMENPESTGEPVILEEAVRCPPNCPQTSGLYP